MARPAVLRLHRQPPLLQAIGSRPIGRVSSLAAIGLLALVLAGAPLTGAAAGVIGTAAAVGTLLQPALGSLLVALSIPVGSLLPGLGAYLSVPDLMVILAVAAWAARAAAARQTRIRPVPLAVPLLALLWVLAASLTQAASWREGLPELFKWLEFTILYFVAVQTLDRRHVPWVIGALLLGGVLQTVIGAYQFLAQIGPEAFVLMGRFMRAYGTFGQPNPYAGYLGYLTPVAASLCVAYASRWLSKRRLAHGIRTVALGSVSMALAAGIVMSWSRGAWLGVIAALVAVLALWSRRRIIALVAVGLSAVLLLASPVAVGLLPEGVAGRLSDLTSYVSITDPTSVEITDANFSVLERLAHWQAGWRMFESHPWLGVGIGNYAVAYPAYAPAHWYDPLGHAHNVFVNFLAETGFLGGSLFVWFWLASGILILRLSRHGDIMHRALVYGVAGTWVYLSIHNLFDNMFVQHMQLQFALLLAAATASLPKASVSAGRAHRDPLPDHSLSTNTLDNEAHER